MLVFIGFLPRFAPICPDFFATFRLDKCLYSRNRPQGNPRPATITQFCPDPEKGRGSHLPRYFPYRKILGRGKVFAPICPDFAPIFFRIGSGQAKMDLPRSAPIFSGPQVNDGHLAARVVNSTMRGAHISPQISEIFSLASWVRPRASDF